METALLARVKFLKATLRKATLPAALAGITIIALSCVGPSSAPCPDGTQRNVSYWLFFGQDHADGRSVSPEEWEAFVAEVITPRFPQGLSVLDAKGQWLRPNGELERENTKVVSLLHPPPVEDGMRLVNEIAREYEQRLNQDPVFRMVTEKTCSGLYAE